MLLEPHKKSFFSLIRLARKAKKLGFEDKSTLFLSAFALRPTGILNDRWSDRLTDKKRANCPS